MFSKKIPPYLQYILLIFLALALSLVILATYTSLSGGAINPPLTDTSDNLISKNLITIVELEDESSTTMSDALIINCDEPEDLKNN